MGATHPRTPAPACKSTPRAGDPGGGGVLISEIYVVIDFSLRSTVGALIVKKLGVGLRRGRRGRRRRRIAGCSSEAPPLPPPSPALPWRPLIDRTVAPYRLENKHLSNFIAPLPTGGLPSSFAPHALYFLEAFS